MYGSKGEERWEWRVQAKVIYKENVDLGGIVIMQVTDDTRLNQSAEEDP